MSQQRPPEAAQWLAAIVESSDDAIVSKDLNGIVSFWNQAAERIFGYTADEMVGRSIRTIIPDDRQAEEDRVLAAVRAGERVDHYETIRRRKDGSMVPISLTVSPIRNSAGEIVGASKIARDISERRQIEAERTRLLAAVQETNRLKDEFLATLSHELRTPLNAILGYTRMIRSGLVTGERQARAVEIIERNATALTQMVEEVLDVSRIISGKLRLNRQPVDLPRVIRDAVDAVAPAAEAKNIRLDLELDSDIVPGTLAGDPDRLQQVVWNLLSNAVKFTGRGGSVRVTLSQADDHAQLVVRDTGIGIPREFVPHLFERFRQADAGTAREQGGLGLGLAISRQLIEMHGGMIAAASEGEGRGATFIVRLPMLTAGRFAPDRIGADAARGASASFQALDGIHVLAVDDDPDSLQMLGEILEVKGARVTLAGSAPHALAHLLEITPDVIVADIGMPHMDGFALIAQVRKHANPEVQAIPAAALTAYARSEDRVRALESGFQVHLPKPIDPPVLISAVAELARSRATTRQP